MRKPFQLSAKLATTIILFATAFLFILIRFGPRLIGGAPSASDWAQEIEKRGWRVLHWKETDKRVVVICDAGGNKIAVLDTDWPSKGFSTVNIMDSDHHGITSGEFEVLMKEGWSVRKPAWGCIVRILPPQDGRIRIVHQAGYSFRGETMSGGEKLLDVEVNWNVGEPLQKP